MVTFQSLRFMMDINREILSLRCECEVFFSYFMRELRKESLRKTLTNIIPFWNHLKGQTETIIKTFLFVLIYSFS